MTRPVLAAPRCRERNAPTPLRAAARDVIIVPRMVLMQEDVPIKVSGGCHHPP
jgi:hypothetical protein